VFEEVTKREGGRRAAQRSAWLAGSTALQALLIGGVVVVSASLAKKVSEGPLVPVKIVRQAAPTPPKPPPPPPAPKAQVKVKPKVEAKPRQAMIQPKEMPQELKPPDPTPPEPEDEGSDEGVEGGVIGGVVGGVVGGAPPPPPPPPAPAGPVKFNDAMTKPMAVTPPDIQYTQQAQEREVEGTMLVECVVTVDGTVHNCRVLKSLPFMDRAVVSALERARYKPATLGGKPIDVQYTFTIKLRLPQ
jgi:periplasmic protein TonB